ncbi:hypothetical protein FDECE_11203 [Fusarium decemcellulare]|nr:hypothetical protein FDECE_11203 [Fusarium decemcellulare]
MDTFDPYTQNVTFLFADGQTKVEIPMPVIDLWRREIASICINYGTQFGACVIMLITLLVMTPMAKFRRPSNILHAIGLVVCAIRMLLLSLYYLHSFTDFYVFWTRDYSHVPTSELANSIAANTMSLLLVIIIELALMNQAWTMVSLWPDFWKYAISLVSATITLLTIASRIAFSVLQNKANLAVTTARSNVWLTHWMVVMNVLSISWFCAIFNIKLIWHLISNRGVLPSYKALTPMEVLVMTNGILMIIPVIFAGLEWGHWTNFEAASLTLTSVAIILPLGTLAAQRLAASNTSFSYSSAASSGRYPIAVSAAGTGSSMVPLKAPSFTTHRATSDHPAAVFSRCEAGMSSRDHMNPVDLELGKLSDADADGRHVRVDRNVVQREERL